MEHRYARTPILAVRIWVITELSAHAVVAN